ncbi:YdcF family protein [Pseudomonas mangiferae]|uniref:YdcF family protein n=1 Tax=Pseudomonas mangiferae TaxID=2593654 RepID=A0A553GXP6_9PSED|nr:YdcF family protein [Pseudomonas mangiferae]TRX74274.1 YdcF family protein [Pseudomonas mangiferae]
MPLRYILKQLLLPPGCLLLLLLLAWWWRRRRPRLAAGCFVIGFGGLLLMSLPVVVEHAARALEREPTLAQADWPGLAGRAQAIVVLGAGRERDAAWQDPQPGLMANERLRYAARLARASGLPLLTSGGLHYGEPPSEAAIMAASLREDYQVAVRWEEGHSRTTWENAVESARLLAADGVTRVVLVTQAWHMARARWCFERQGLEVVAAPVGSLADPPPRPLDGWLPESRAVWQNGMLLNEAVGLLAYPLVYR